MTFGATLEGWLNGPPSCPSLKAAGDGEGIATVPGAPETTLPPFDEGAPPRVNWGAKAPRAAGGTCNVRYWTRID
jgi:hypothetical protein